MNTSKPVIDRKTIVEYHLLGSLLIAFYLLISLQTDSFWKIIPIISIAGMSIVAADVLFSFKRPIWHSDISIIKNQIQQFVFDSSPYLFTAMVVLITEAYMPVAIVGRTLAAVVSIGIFVAMGIAFELEFNRIKSNIPVNIGVISKIAPSSIKLRYFLGCLISIVIFNFAFSCLAHYFKDYGQQHAEKEFMEVMFISSVTVGFSIYLFYLYNRNFIYVLGMQVNALRRVEEGSFDVTVPIVSDDELALLASYHNTMIERLRDRERLYRTLERSVGANIMNKLLNTDEQTLKQGQAYDVAILFCDLRGFTSLGESASAEEIILFLNVYFANVSGVISEHNGIINKFMGDAVLAIFGLEGKGNNPVDEAVCAGLAIIEHSADIFMPNAMHPETGVGIDFGSVIGGTIGSDERYEYTIIGDAVNRASRLEGLSKRLDYSMILSQEAYDELSDDMRLYFSDLGAHKVRGRNMPVTIFGSVKKPKKEESVGAYETSGRRSERR